MTSEERGRGGLANFCPKEGRLRGYGTEKGEGGVQNSDILADVIYVWPLVGEG